MFLELLKLIDVRSNTEISEDKDDGALQTSLGFPRIDDDKNEPRELPPSSPLKR